MSTKTKIFQWIRKHVRPTAYKMETKGPIYFGLKFIFRFGKSKSSKTEADRPTTENQK